MLRTLYRRILVEKLPGPCCSAWDPEVITSSTLNPLRGNHSRADGSSSLVHIWTRIRTLVPRSGRLACADDLTGTMQILHRLPHGEPLPLAMALTPPAARVHYPPPQDNLPQ